MATATELRHWDFTQVLEFNNTLYPHTAADQPSPTNQEQDVLPKDAKHGSDSGYDSIGSDAASDAVNDPSKLGDFSKVWHFLGTPIPTSDTSIGVQFPQDINTSAGIESLHDIASVKHDYASDGAAYTTSTLPEDFQWTDGTDGEEPIEPVEPVEPVITSTPQPLTKNQRKKARRRERNKLLQEMSLGQFVDNAVSDSEYTAAKQAPARKASAHVVHNGQVPPASSPGHRDTPAAVEQTQPGHKSTADLQVGSMRRLQYSQASLKHLSGKDRDFDPAVTSPSDKIAWVNNISDDEAVNAVAQASRYIQQGLLPSTPTPMERNKQESAAATPADHRTPGGVLSPKQTTYKAVSSTPNAATRFTPSSLQPVQSPKPATQQNAKNPTFAPPTGPRKKANPGPTIEPLTIRSGEDRQLSLYLNIYHAFPEDRKHVSSPANMLKKTYDDDGDGVHVFVDASNIILGFLDQLKRARSIHPRHRLDLPDLSFDGLVLLMERQRPVAKRILVGSTPHLTAFDIAKSVGYECHILEKVFKARELTERKLYFRALDAKRSGKTPKGSFPGKSATSFNGGGSGSGSETNTPQFEPARYIEQGVDEILHLKMMESIVDYEPATMVLATGDAAAAEYSAGFMVMVERALHKGWKVELISWRQNTSSMYTNGSFRQQWGEKFKISYLDDFAEDLLDT